MNQGFKLRFDQMRDSNPTGPDAGLTDGGSASHPTSGHTRSLCLVWPDGRKMFFNYAYLIAGEFRPDDDKNSIQLSFSSHTVSLHGYGLNSLFIDLLDHLPRLIVMTDARYALTEDDESAVIVNIVVEKKDS